MPKKTFHVYILSSRSRNLCTGMTGDLRARVYEHKTKTRGSFTAKYNIDRLVYFEEQPGPREAFERERELKTWLRSRKIALIEAVNAGWDDLSEGWYDLTDEPDSR
jgi:Predicted endonuclease containing a URI domain